MDVNITEEKGNPRKRQRNEKLWKRNVAKRERYASPGFIPSRNFFRCKHKKCNTQCHKIQLEDAKHFHSSFYLSCEKSVQDAFLVKFTEGKSPDRARKSENERLKTRTLSIQYFVRTQVRKKVRVCQNLFLTILGLKKHRVIGAVKRFHQNNNFCTEARGGDRKKVLFHEKRICVKNLIERLQACESHYCRGKSKRVYLPSTLNISKLYRMYCAEEENPKVKASYFRKIFCDEYNVGFGAPQTDACSTCLQNGERIKNAATPQIKNDCIIKQRLHQLKARAFYHLLKEESKNVVIISFDCQKNQVLPKVPDQIAYYSRQLYIYNLTICIGSSKTPQNKENCFCFHWLENEHAKSSNEISSAVYHLLTEKLNTFAPEVDTVRFVSDGCGGQNKNTNMVAMISMWLLNNAPRRIKSCEMIFPMVGHSFLPPDRVFARIEKELKKMDTIIEPQEYIDVYARHGTPINLAGNVFDFKNLFHSIVKPPSQWHFKFNPAKRLYFRLNQAQTDVQIKGDVNYRHSMGQYKSITKKGMSLSGLNPVSIQPGKPVNQLKLDDVKKLLNTHFGDGWSANPRLIFYKTVLGGPIGAPDDDASDGGECENVTEEFSMHI